MNCHPLQIRFRLSHPSLHGSHTAEDNHTLHQRHKNYDKNTLIIGDFNSNARWDKARQRRSHSTVVKELQEIGLVSAYHYVSGETHGEETQFTFFMYKQPDKKYHIG